MTPQKLDHAQYFYFCRPLNSCQRVLTYDSSHPTHGDCEMVREALGTHSHLCCLHKEMLNQCCSAAKPTGFDFTSKAIQLAVTNSLKGKQPSFLLYTRRKELVAQRHQRSSSHHLPKGSVTFDSVRSLPYHWCLLASPSLKYQPTLRNSLRLNGMLILMWLFINERKKNLMPFAEIKHLFDHGVQQQPFLQQNSSRHSRLEATAFKVTSSLHLS